jgi:hypothetical protein
MAASKLVSKHNADSLCNDSGRFSGPRAHKLCATKLLGCLCCCIIILHGYARPCRAQDPPAATDNQTLAVNFISLKPGNTIASTQLKLLNDKTLGFAIEETPLVNVQGSWSQGQNSFSANVWFAVDKQTSFHYRLDFEGYRLKNLYGGLAYLSEYDRNGRLIQKISFLFYAAPPDTPGNSGKDERP